MGRGELGYTELIDPDQQAHKAIKEIDELGERDKYSAQFVPTINEFPEVKLGSNYGSG